jgi:hypothetical protein
MSESVQAAASAPLVDVRSHVADATDASSQGVSLSNTGPHLAPHVAKIPSSDGAGSQLMGTKPTSDRFDCHSISLRSKMWRSDKEGLQGELQCVKLNVTSLTAGYQSV